MGSLTLVGDRDVVFLEMSVCLVTVTLSYSESSVRIGLSGDLEGLRGADLGPLEGDSEVGFL